MAASISLYANVVADSLKYDIFYTCKHATLCDKVLDIVPINNLDCHQIADTTLCSNRAYLCDTKMMRSNLKGYGKHDEPGKTVRAYTHISINKSDEEQFLSGSWSHRQVSGLASWLPFFGQPDTQHEWIPAESQRTTQHYSAISIQLAKPLWMIPDEATRAFGELVDLTHPLLTNSVFTQGISAFNDFFDLSSPVLHDTRQQILKHVAENDYQKASNVATQYIFYRSTDAAFTAGLGTLPLKEMYAIILLTYIYTSIVVDRVFRVLDSHHLDPEGQPALRLNHEAALPPLDKLPWLKDRDVIALPRQRTLTCQTVKTALSIVKTLMKLAEMFERRGKQRCGTKEAERK
ncbi:Hypothetical protein D9617_36g062930 [Elsinoe fawcettii]|nr:Hypothetical protein D9617_36g062930 [Elsinoe fawcettii]